MKVGFIGLGAMGFPMAQRIVKAGFPTITTFHKNRAPADALAALGAQIAPTPAEVADAADVMLTMLPADKELEEVVCGTNGILRGFSPGKVLIEMTTCTAMTLLKVEGVIQSAGGRVLDAPVSGGTTGAAAGALTIMVGGDLDLLNEYRNLLGTVGARIVHVGGTGQGKVVKIINQALSAIHLLAIGETFALGIRCGVDPALLFDVLRDSSGYSRMMDLRLPDFILTGSFEPGFKLDLMKKDVLLALESARSQTLPALLTSAAAQIFTAASAAGDGASDFSKAAQYIAGLGKVSLSDKRRMPA